MEDQVYPQSESAAHDPQEEEWSGYTDVFVDHARNPRNVGSIQGADGFASMTSDCGDTMGIWLKVSGRVIENVTFWTDGCFSAIATGSMVTELAKGRGVLDALAINQQAVLDALGGMPEDSAHCALLAADTLCEAIRDYLANEREPWKRAYRRQS